MSVKFYAVKKGRKTGVFNSWAECKEQIDGFSGAVYKSFPTAAEAFSFAMGMPSQAPAADTAKNTGTVKIPSTDSAAGTAKNAGTLPAVYAFVDGSYNSKTHVYGYGGYLFHHGQKELLTGCGNDPEMAAMRNVSGEVLGSLAAMEKAFSLGLSELTIYYDYMGIEMWATGAWKRNKKGTIAYHEQCQKLMQRLTVHFVKVKGHSGVEGNEEADILAKKAVGIL